MNKTASPAAPFLSWSARRLKTLAVSGCWVMKIVLLTQLTLPAGNEVPTTHMLKGGVFLVDKDNERLMVDTKAEGRRLVHWTKATSFRFAGDKTLTESSWAKVRVDQYIMCVGKWDDQLRLAADVCVHRGFE